MRLLMVSRTEPHDALRVAVVDMVALCRLGAADLAGPTVEFALPDLVPGLGSDVLLVLCFSGNSVSSHGIS
jgi:hypothetical protein